MQGSMFHVRSKVRHVKGRDDERELDARTFPSTPSRLLFTSSHLARNAACSWTDR
jgi:hypothetical protein